MVQRCPEKEEKIKELPGTREMIHEGLTYKSRNKFEDLDVKNDDYPEIEAVVPAVPIAKSISPECSHSQSRLL